MQNETQENVKLCFRFACGAGPRGIRSWNPFLLLSSILLDHLVPPYWFLLFLLLFSTVIYVHMGQVDTILRSSWEFHHTT